jgi:zinc protease
MVGLSGDPEVSPVAFGEADALAAIAERVSRASGRAEAVEFVESCPFGAFMQVEKYRLANGLTVLLLVDPAAPVVAYQTWYRVGSRHERPGRTGMAHLFEHLMFKGTTKHPEGVFDRLLEEAGASTNAATWVDWTYYRENLPRAAFDLVVGLESDRMAHLKLGGEELESERSVVMNERKLRVDNEPEGTIFERLYTLAFPGHPYGWPTIGWMEDIRAISREDCEEFYRVHYAPNNATVVIVGDVQREAALARLVECYGEFEPQAPPPEPVAPAEGQTCERRETLRLHLTAPVTALGYKSVALGDPDAPALEVLMEILCNSQSARIEKRLVTDLELANEVSGWVDGFTLPGLTCVFVQQKPGVAPDDIIGHIEDEIATVVRDGPAPLEVESARHKMEIGFVRGMLAVSSRARMLGTFEATIGDYKLMMARMVAYRDVTADDVARVAGRYLRPARRTTIVALPREES